MRNTRWQLRHERSPWLSIVIKLNVSEAMTFVRCHTSHLVLGWFAFEAKMAPWCYLIYVGCYHRFIVRVCRFFSNIFLKFLRGNWIRLRIRALILLRQKEWSERFLRTVRETDAFGWVLAFIRHEQGEETKKSNVDRTIGQYARSQWTMVARKKDANGRRDDAMDMFRGCRVRGGSLGWRSRWLTCSEDKWTPDLPDLIMFGASYWVVDW